MVAVSSGATTAMPHTALTALTPAMVAPGTSLQVTQPLSGVTFTLPTITTLPSDGTMDQRRNWWHIEEVRCMYIPFNFFLLRTESLS